MSGTDDDGSLLSRWAMRKRAVAQQEKAEHEQADIEAEAQVALADPERIGTAAEPEEETDEQILERLGLPDPDAMEKGDDFSAFMTSTVPARIRNRALRRLWISNPVLANLDELVDYGEDFTDAATVIENLQTAYQVGRGFMRDEDYADADDEDAGDTGSGDEETGDEIAASDGAPDEDASATSEINPSIAGDSFAGASTHTAPPPKPRRDNSQPRVHVVRRMMPACGTPGQAPALKVPTPLFRWGRRTQSQ
jgi:hypothetical protein